MLIRDIQTGAVYVVGDNGKRHIGGFEWKCWQGAGETTVPCSSADAASIPDVAHAQSTSADKRTYTAETREMGSQDEVEDATFVTPDDVDNFGGLRDS